MEAIHDASHLYQVERRETHAARPGFRINELQLSPTQRVPWHYHSHIQDCFYVLDGRLSIELKHPQQTILLEPGETFAVAPRRPHLVTNAGDSSVSFLVLQGIGEYDYIPLESGD